MNARHLQPTRKLVHLGQQCILAFYAVFFACVLPFLCWGGVATPGHPHKHAHFVFSVPQSRENPASAQPHVHFPQYIDGQWVFEQTHAHAQSDSGLPLRSEPDFTLITLLLLLLAGVVTLAFTPLSLFSRRLIHHLPNSLIQTPSAPPPKLRFLLA